MIILASEPPMKVRLFSAFSVLLHNPTMTNSLYIHSSFNPRRSLCYTVRKSCRCYDISKIVHCN